MVVATSCTLGADASVSYHTNVVTIKVGQDVYLDETDSNRLKLADNTPQKPL